MTSRSSFLTATRPALRALVDRLGRRFDFFSVLATDCAGTNFESTPGERRATESMWTERGFVARAIRAGRVVEHSFDLAPPEEESLPAFADGLGRELDELLSQAAPDGFLSVSRNETPLRAERFSEVLTDPLTLSASLIFERLDAIRSRAAAASPCVAMARSRAEWARFSKLYLSKDRELEQSYLWGQAYVFVAARRNGVDRETFDAVSGLKGMELLDELDAYPEKTAALAVELLDSAAIEPGEYTVVLSPDMAGMLAHEAFGHGVETDMFAKGRAKAASFVGKRVGSPLLTMYDGAAAAEQTGSYLFDDEGASGSTTKILDAGILLGGISDLLSAEELGLPETGNGRRWNFERKAYARMTNTFFAAGESKSADLIAGVDYGWLLDRAHSGMEDPKNWGIQLVALVGREIRDGRFTGRIASPVVCTGSVPEVLNAVDGVADEVELKGNGYCGKGHKELAKVSSGGPWIRTRMRLG